MKIDSRFVLILLSGFLGTTLWAAEPPSESAALRSALRDTMLQLRTAQADLAALQATQPALIEDKKALSENYEALKKQTVTDRMATDKTLAGLGAENAELKTAMSRLTEELRKAREEGQKMAQAARAAEEQGATLAQDKIVLERRLADREGKNLALFLLGNEILTRYEEYSLGKVVLAKEPFVGLTRTKLENLVQEYQDKLLDQRVKP